MIQVKVALITGSDSGYFKLLQSAVQSLQSSKLKYGFDLVILDLGLSDEHKRILRDQTTLIIKPEWYVDVPSHLKTNRNLAFSSRTVLPQVIPGYDVYFWFDCDGWVQDDSFYRTYMEGVGDADVAVVRDKQPGYSSDWDFFKWSLGNHVLSFGLWTGVRSFLSPPVNAGYFAARADSALWPAWRKRYEEAVHRSGKINMDQHALQTIIKLDHVKAAYLPGENNWICSRATPSFDESSQRFCVPYAPFTPIRIIHLAGRSKATEYKIRSRQGNSMSKSVTFPGISSLCKAAEML
jgi:hypothetical protein